MIIQQASHSKNFGDYTYCPLFQNLSFFHHGSGCLLRIFIEIFSKNYHRSLIYYKFNGIFLIFFNPGNLLNTISDATRWNPFWMTIPLDDSSVKDDLWGGGWLVEQGEGCTFVYHVSGGGGAGCRIYTFFFGSSSLCFHLAWRVPRIEW